MAVHYFFVIDDPRFVPSEGYEPRQVGDAANELRGKHWRWYIKDEASEAFYRLNALAHDAKVDDFMERKLDDPRRLSVGTGHTYLLIHPDLTYELYVPVER